MSSSLIVHALLIVNILVIDKLDWYLSTIKSKPDLCLKRNTFF